MHIIANWKMHGDAARLSAWIAALSPTLKTLAADVSAVLCPPALWVAKAAELANNESLAVGGQDCHGQPQGAFTGAISAPMLASAGARYVILGHSERRTTYHETCAEVAAKALAAQAARLIPIICIGETKAEREAGKTLEVISQQLQNSCPEALNTAIIAYEPVWAIGTGLTPTESDIEAAHSRIHNLLKMRQQTRDIRFPVVYGGSVNAGNAASILAIAGVDGALVGGASLDATQFSPILAAAAEAAKRNTVRNAG